MLLRRGIISSGLSGDVYVGQGDVPGIPAAAVVFSDHRWKAGIGTNNTEVLVLATPSDIGYDNNKFSGPEWDTATTSGANTATTSVWYDQIGSDNAVQASTTMQPETTRDGVHEFDGTNDVLISPFQLTDGAACTIIIITSGNGSLSDAIMSITGATNGSVRIRPFSTSLEANWVSGASGSNPWRWLAPDYFSGTRGMIVFTYNSSTGGKCYFNGSPLTQNRIGTTGVLDVNVENLQIGGAFGGGQTDSSIEELVIFDGEELGQTQVTDLYNQWVINDAL